MKYQNNFEEETVFRIDAFDLNELIAEEYGFEDFETMLGQPNDSIMEVCVSGQFNTYEEKEWLTLKNGGPQNNQTLW